MATKLNVGSIWIRICLLLALFTACLKAQEPIRLHPENGRYFLFRDRPTVLVGSSEHYGALINLEFDYIRYLEEIRASGLNLTRIFAGTYRETAGAFNIEDNTLSPQPGRSVAPWKRTGVPGAGDGGGKFDLSQWDPAYFFRLRNLVSEAGKRGIVVELTFFSSIYDDSLWAVSPMNAANHVNGVGAGGRTNCYSPSGDLVPTQKAFVRKCAGELKDFDNVIYEICNEPYAAGITQAWQDAMIGELVTTEAALPQPHLIAQNVFNNQGAVTNPNPAVSLFNFHYAYPNAASQNLGLNRAIGDDETGFAGQEDFAYRKEAWEFLLAGGSLFNHLDYSFTATREDGIASQNAPGGGGPGIRHQLGILRWFMEELPLTGLAPQVDFVASGVPSGGAARVIGVPGVAYGLYLRGGSQATLMVNLPSGTYRGQWMDPRSGLVTAAVAEFTHSGGRRTLVSPNYGEDAALRLLAVDQASPEIAITSPAYNRIIPGSANSLVVSASVSSGVAQGVEFFDGEKSLGWVNAPPFELTVENLEQGQHIFRAKAVGQDGRGGFSPPVRAAVLGAFHSGVNLNGNSLVVDGEVLRSESEAVSAGLVVTNTQPATTTGAITLYPTPDASTALLLNDQLLRASSVGNAELGLRHPVSNGRYDVFLFIVEGQASYSRDMRVSLEGKTVARGIGDLAKGEWHKYGPYRVTVTDGMLDLGLQQESKGVPKIAAFSIYQAPPAAVFTEGALEIELAEDVVVLSYPADLPSAKIEASDDLAQSDGWKELVAPLSSFSDRNVIAVPVDRASRFFRLRMD